MKNIEDVVEIKFVNFNYSAAIEDYILKKISKHENESSLINLIKVTVSSLSNNKLKMYQLCVEVDLRNAGFIVKKNGLDIYGLVDEVSDAYRKKLVKLIDVQSEHPKGLPKAEEIPFDQSLDSPINFPAGSIDNIDINKYLILEEKSFNDHTPLHLEEAIDLMELIGRQCILFKNINTGKYSVVYKIKDGVKEGYGIINSKM